MHGLILVTLALIASKISATSQDEETKLQNEMNDLLSKISSEAGDKLWSLVNSTGNDKSLKKNLVAILNYQFKRVPFINNTLNYESQIDVYINKRLSKYYRLFACDLNTPIDCLRNPYEEEDFRNGATAIVHNEGSTYFYSIKIFSTGAVLKFWVIRIEIDSTYSGYMQLMQEQNDQLRRILNERFGFGICLIFKQ